MKMGHILAAFCLLAFALCASSSHAQVTWMTRLQPTSFSAQYNKVSSDAGLDDFGDFTLLLMGYFGANDRLNIIVQVPIASVYENEANLVDSSYWNGPRYIPFLEPQTFNAFTVGNPYVGIEITDNSRSAPIVQLGVRLPVVQPKGGIDDYINDRQLVAAVNGMGISSEQFEAFAPDQFSANIAVGHRFRRRHGKSDLETTLLGGATMMKQSGDTRTYFDFNPEFWLIRRKVEYGVGLHARLSGRSEEGSFFDRLESQLGFSMNFRPGRVHPVIHLRIPSVLGDSGNDRVSFFFGLHCTVAVM